MIDLEELNTTWSILVKNWSCKTDAQIINFYRAVQHGKVTEDDAAIVKRINLLFDMMAEAQEKAFGPIVDKALKKD